LTAKGARGVSDVKFKWKESDNLFAELEHQAQPLQGHTFPIISDHEDPLTELSKEQKRKKSILREKGGMHWE
jgi:hypothetical protein